MNRRNFLVASAIASTVTPFVSRAEVSCGAVFYPGIGLLPTCTAGILSPLVAMSAEYQHTTEWCWAASISMIFRFHRHPVEQARIVQETWGQIVNQPGTNDQILADLSRKWTDDHGNDFQSSCDVMDANPVTASQDLGNDMPLLICALGHAMVLTALTYVSNPTAPGGASVTAATVRDPWPGNGGRRVLSPQEWYNVSLLVRVRIDNA